MTTATEVETVEEVVVVSSPTKESTAPPPPTEEETNAKSTNTATTEVCLVLFIIVTSNLGFYRFIQSTSEFIFHDPKCTNLEKTVENDIINLG